MIARDSPARFLSAGVRDALWAWAAGALVGIAYLLALPLAMVL